MNKGIRVLLISITALIVAFALALFYITQEFITSRPSEVGQEVVYEVPSGRSFIAIAKDLQDKGIIKSATMFNVYARLTGQRSKLKRGEYLFKTNMTPPEVISVLTSGKSIARAVTISEGLSIYEIAEIFAEQGLSTAPEFLRLIKDRPFIESLLGEKQDSLEGYLFPETYMLTKYTDAKTVISNMVKRFLVVYEGVKIEAQSEVQGWTRHQIVTLASIIEKETGAPHERPLISSVFHNRLKKNMRLQTDPTVIYGKAETSGKLEISITRADLTTPTRYNTYTIFGLPPGPIANPGREALLAAIKPATSDYLFFVSQNDGTHVFTQEYKDHRAAVAKYQLDRKAREGKSWRDLKKKPNK